MTDATNLRRARTPGAYRRSSGGKLHAAPVGARVALCGAATRPPRDDDRAFDADDPQTCQRCARAARATREDRRA